MPLFVIKPDFFAKIPEFTAKHRIFSHTVKNTESAYLGRIQFRCKMRHAQVRPSCCASSSEFHGLPCDCIVTDTDVPTIRHRFKRGLFSRWPCTSPNPWACIQDCSSNAIGFNNSSCALLVLILRCHSSCSMPARPAHEIDQDLPIVHPGMICPDGNWLSKSSRQNQAGSNAVASPIQQKKIDGLTGTWLQAIVPRMRKAGEVLRGIASIRVTQWLWICIKLLKMFSCATPS